MVTLFIMIQYNTIGLWHLTVLQTCVSKKTMKYTATLSSTNNAQS